MKGEKSMKDVKMQDDIRNHFESVKLPKIDVSQGVKEKITHSHKKRTGSFRKVSLVFVALAFLFMTGFVASQIFELKDLNGNTTWFYKIMNEEDRYREIANKKLESMNLKEGQSVAIYVTQYNPDRIVSYHTVPVKIEDFDELRETIGDLFKMPHKLLGEYMFLEGEVSYNAKNIDTISLLEEAKKSDEEVIARETETSSDIMSVYISYTKDDTKIKVGIIDVNDKTDTLINTENNNAEVVMLHNVEAIYEIENNKQNVSWLIDGKWFVISGDLDKVSKEELILLAKEVNK